MIYIILFQLLLFNYSNIRNRRAQEEIFIIVYYIIIILTLL
jgi:hypothetical protein